MNGSTAEQQAEQAQAMRAAPRGEHVEYRRPLDWDFDHVPLRERE
jgi:hypothetical protein